MTYIKEDEYVPGAWNAMCDRCGRKRKSTEMRKTWQGYYVCFPEHYEERHPQDFVRAKVEKTAPDWIRPDQPCIMVADACPLLKITGPLRVVVGLPAVFTYDATGVLKERMYSLSPDVAGVMSPPIIVVRPGATMGTFTVTFSAAGPTQMLLVAEDLCASAALPIEVEAAAPPPPPPPPPLEQPQTVLAELNFTTAFPGVFPAPEFQASTFLRGPGFTQSLPEVDAAGMWFGASDPACPFGDYPDVLGCLLGVNVLQGTLLVFDGTAPLPMPNLRLLGVEIDYIFQMRPAGLAQPNGLWSFRYRVGLQSLRVEFEYDGRVFPVVDRVRMYLEDSGFEELVGEFNFNNFTTQPRRVRLQVGNFAGQPNENALQLYLFDQVSSTYSLIGASPPGFGGVLIYSNSIDPLSRIEIAKLELPTPGSLLNVQAVRTVPWLPVS